MSTARRCLKSPRSLSGTSPHPTMVTQVNIMVMNRWLTSFSFIANRPPHSWDKVISDSDLETPRSRSWVCQRARSYNRPSIILTHFLFISHQSDQQFRRYSYFKIWPWNIQGQCHEWGQRSRSHIVPSIQPMHFLFVSHQSDQPFLRYGEKSILILKKHIWNCLRKFAKITVFSRMYPKSNQVITMTRATKLPRFVMIWWVVLTLSCRQANFC